MYHCRLANTKICSTSKMPFLLLPSTSILPLDSIWSPEAKLSSSQFNNKNGVVISATAAKSSSSTAQSPNPNQKTQKKDDDYHATLKALNSKGRFPRKSLGQHYMLNGSINEQLVETAKVQEGDVVLEIGPGTGSLTNVLVDSGAHVLAIEKDLHMAALVNERFSSINKVKVLEEDFTRCHVRFHLSSFLASSSLDGLSQRAKVVSNIPFNISTDVIKHLLPMGDLISEVVLLLQEEAALRLVDQSLSSSEYRPVNVFINFYSDPEYRFKVPRENFFPQPKVDAAVVSFKLKQAIDYPQVSCRKSFFSMVNAAFNGKRKMLRKSLQHICPSNKIETALGEAGLPATSRPEELSLEDFVRLHNSIVDLQPVLKSEPRVAEFETEEPLCL